MRKAPTVKELSKWAHRAFGGKAHAAISKDDEGARCALVTNARNHIVMTGYGADGLRLMRAALVVEAMRKRAAFLVTDLVSTRDSLREDGESTGELDTVIELLGGEDA